MFTQGACITDNIQVWEIVITVTTTIYLLIEVHQACSEVSSVNLFLLKLSLDKIIGFSIYPRNRNLSRSLHEGKE